MTASSGIGEYVTELYCELLSSSQENRSFVNDLTEGDIAADGLLGVSVSAHSPLSLEQINQCAQQSTAPRTIVACPPVPPLESLAEDFQNNLQRRSLVQNDGARSGAEHGSVTLYGRQCRVAHPITSFGLESFGKPKSETSTS